MRQESSKQFHDNICQENGFHFLANGCACNNTRTLSKEGCNNVKFHFNLEIRDIASPRPDESKIEF